MSKSWKRRRAEEFRQMDGDGMDAIAKAIEAIAPVRATLPQDVQDWLDKRAEIKTRHPKPAQRRP